MWHSSCTCLWTNNTVMTCVTCQCVTERLDCITTTCLSLHSSSCDHLSKDCNLVNKLFVWLLYCLYLVWWFAHLEGSRIHDPNMNIHDTVFFASLSSGLKSGMRFPSLPSLRQSYQFIVVLHFFWWSVTIVFLALFLVSRANFIAISFILFMYSWPTASIPSRVLQNFHTSPRTFA